MLLFSCFDVQIGESVINEDCSERYTCLATGVVKQEPISCRSDEICKVKNGVRGCNLQQCSITASGEVSLFNGQQGYFEKEGIFELAKLCVHRLGTDWFRVLVAVRPCRAQGHNCVMAAYVFFNNNFIAVNRQHDTWVRHFQLK